MAKRCNPSHWLCFVHLFVIYVHCKQIGLHVEICKLVNKDFMQENVEPTRKFIKEQKKGAYPS